MEAGPGNGHPCWSLRRHEFTGVSFNEALWAEEPGEEEEEAGHGGHHSGARCFGEADKGGKGLRGEVSEDGGESTESEAHANENRELVGEEEGGGGRDDEHCDDDDGADGFEGGDRRDGNHGHEEVVDDLGVEALGFGEAGVEGSQGEFLVEEGDDHDVQKEGNANHQCGAGNLPNKGF